MIGIHGSTEGDSFIGACAKALRQRAFYYAYDKTFSTVPADSEDLRYKVYSLRYQVYCLENEAIVPPRTQNLLIEKDEFDDRAVHHLLIHRASGAEAGTLRVLFADPDYPLRSFEMQKICDHPLLRMDNKIRNLCEISRFCMTGAFRRRPRDGRYLPAYHEQEGGGDEPPTGLFRRRIPYASLGLLRAAFSTALDRRIVNCIMTVESGHLPTLRRLGFHYRSLGQRLARFGFEEPLIFNIKAVLDNMMVLNPECWEVISDNGRLHHRASELFRYDWQDSLFDEACQGEILKQIL